MNVLDLPLAEVHAAPQDRKAFDDAELRQLAASITEHGLAQPITVRPDDAGWIIVAGERRFRAHQLIGAKTIKAIVRDDMTDAQASAVQLIENVQRTDLDPFEEANAYRSRMDRFDMTDDAVAEWAGKPVAYVRKRLDLLALDAEWQALVRNGSLPVGHGATMSRLDTNRQRLAVAAFRKADGMAFYPFNELCDRLFAEQNEQSLFDESSFLRVEDMVTSAKSTAKVVGKQLIALADDLGKVVEAVVEQGLGDTLGIDEAHLAGLIARLDQMRRTRLDQSATKKGKR